MAEFDGIWSVFFFMFGSIIGSFLNVCIVRLPYEQSIAFPSSHCVHCKKPIAWFDNIPLLSYWILGGRCRQCKVKISVRYFLVEFLTAVSFLLFYKYFGLNVVLVPYLVMLSGFIVATFVDFEHRIIPDEISIGGTIAGVVFSIFIPQLHSVDVFWKSALWSVVGLLVGGGSIYLMGVLGNMFMPRSIRKIERISKEEFYELLVPLTPDVLEGLWDNLVRSGYMTQSGKVSDTFWQLKNYRELQLDPPFMSLNKKIYKSLKMDTMGGGDVKLMAMVGAFMGWKMALLTFFLAPFFGAFYGMIEKIRTKDSAIAYGPFLILGALLSLFKGEDIIRWILSNYGVTY